MSNWDKVIFVCTDNTCLSVMAEAVMNSVNLRNPLEVCSRGLVVLFAEPMNPKAVAILKSYHMEPAKQSSQPLTAEDLTPGALILTMTEAECRQVKERFGEDLQAYPIGVFVGKPGDIPEPHGGTLADYGACYEYLDLMVKFAAEIILKKE